MAHSKSNTLKVEFKGFRNPRTQKQTGSFLVSTRDKDGSLIDTQTIFNFFVTMTDLATLTDMSVTASNVTNGAYNPYLVTFVSPVGLTNGDKIEITFDSNIKPVPISGGASGTVSCSGASQLSSMTCNYLSNKLTISLTSGVNGASGTYSFNIANVTNPPSTRLYKVVQTAVFIDSSGNQFMQLPATKFVMLQT